MKLRDYTIITFQLFKNDPRYIGILLCEDWYFDKYLEEIYTLFSIAKEKHLPLVYTIDFETIKVFNLYQEFLSCVNNEASISKISYSLITKSFGINKYEDHYFFGFFPTLEDLKMSE